MRHFRDLKLSLDFRPVRCLALPLQIDLAIIDGDEPEGKVMRPSETAAQTDSELT